MSLFELFKAAYRSNPSTFVLLMIATLVIGFGIGYHLIGPSLRP
jgi:hypothetical protein